MRNYIGSIVNVHRFSDIYINIIILTCKGQQVESNALKCE